MVSGEGISLLGKDWLSEVKLNLKEIFRVHEDMLEDERGMRKGFQANIYVDTALIL